MIYFAIQELESVTSEVKYIPFYASTLEIKLVCILISIVLIKTVITEELPACVNKERHTLG